MMVDTVAQPQPLPASLSTLGSSPHVNYPPNLTGPVGASRLSSDVSTMSTPALQRPELTAPGISVSRPDSAVPRPGSTKPGITNPVIHVPVGKISTPLRSGLSQDTPIQSPALTTPLLPASNTWPIDTEKRGVKRERDDLSGAIPVANGTAFPNGTVNPPKAVLNVKSGIAGVRPRPIKKQRMDAQDQTRDLSITQQPTPQGA